MLVRHPQVAPSYLNPLHRWESMNALNAAITEHNGLFHMHYRAQGVDFISHVLRRQRGWLGLNRPEIRSRRPTATVRTIAASKTHA